MKLNRMREEMINSFIDCLKKDTIPWHRGWSSERPFNAVTNTEYHGANALWLTYNQQAQLYKDPRWCTFKQAQSKGWKIKQGSKGTKIEFWSLYDTEEKRKLTRTEAKQLTDELTAEEFTNRVKPVSNTYTVFNGEQIEGIPLYEIRKNVLHLDEFLSGRNKLIENMKVGFKEGGNEAFYSMAEDMIVLPKINQFDNEFEYITTFFHEAGHATGHVSRFNREMPSARGTDIYAREELRAEIASAFAAQTFGIDYTQNKYMENHEAYIQDYINVLENKPNELFAAIKDAEKISDYLIEKGEFGLEKETEMSRDASFMKKMDTYVALHRNYLEELSQSKLPIVINGYGGPGAGKSTACLEITAALKKEGYNAEYVQEYAKELVYEKDMEMLDGSPEHQYEILKEHSDGITFGEGKGGIVKQMSGKAFSDEVANAFKKDEQFRSFTNKVKDVYEFENSKGIPKEFRTTTDDMEVINKDMLLTQHELISNMKQPEMKAPEQNVMDFFKNTGTKTNTKARGMNRRMEMEL